MEQGHQGNMPQNTEAMKTNATLPADKVQPRGPEPGQENSQAAGPQAAAASSATAGGRQTGLPGADHATPGDEEAAAHQRHHQWAPQPLPPGYAVDPATGQVYFVGPVHQQPVYQQPFHQQPLYPSQPPVYHGGQQPGMVYVQMETPEQAAARQAMEQQRYGQIVQSFEQFMQGEATISDVVKTLYTNTAQYDQLWKGALVGAAATVLLTSKPVREAMGKTFGSLFPGLQPQQPAADAAVDPLTSGKE